MISENFGNLMSHLLKTHSFTLQRISPKTNGKDVVTTTLRQGEKLSDEQKQGIIALVEGGECYRCKIGKGKYHYGVSPSAAIKSALEDNDKHPFGSKE